MDGDRKYIVRTLATILMSYKQRPSLSDCGSVAKALVQRFSFLSDSEETGEVCLNMHYRFCVHCLFFSAVRVEVVYLQQSTEHQQEAQA